MDVGSPTLPRIDPLAIVLAAAACLWHGYLITRATNDNFLHMTLAQQLLAGDRPVRDFFDHGWVLQYALSAAAQAAMGQRLLSEAVVVGLAWGISTYVVFRLVRGLTGSRVAATWPALLIIVAGARGYSYPKGIVYAVAAALWWAYLRRPTPARVIAFGAWGAAAFFWRPDHGVLVALAIVLATAAAHGPRPICVARSAMAGATMLALVAPFLVYVHAAVGLPLYVRTGLAQAQYEHGSHGTHEWPLLRFARELIVVAPPDEYAPVIGIRWRSDSLAADRQRILTRYGLEAVRSDGEDVTGVRLSERSLSQLRALLNERLVEDTSGIDRSTATLPRGAWPIADQWRFRYGWLRLRVVPSLDGPGRASELTAALFYALPIVLVAAAPWVRRAVSGATARGLVAFAVWTFAVDAVMVRNPFPARAPDAVILPAIVFGVLLAAVWRPGAVRGPLRLLAPAATIVIAALTTATVAGAGQFTERLAVIAGQWTSLAQARAAWTEAAGELTSEPPLAHYRGQTARIELRLAAYVRECVPPAERLLVLWFAPDIHYY